MLSFLLYQGNALIIITSHIHTSNLSFCPQKNCVWSRCHGRVHLCVSVVQEGVSLSHYQTALPHPPSGCVNLELWIIQGNWPWFTHTHTPSGHTHSTVLSAGLRDIGTTFKPMCLNNTSHLSMLGRAPDSKGWTCAFVPCYVRNALNSPLRRKKHADTKPSLISGAVHFSSPNRLLKTFMSHNKTLYYSLGRPNPWSETQQSCDVFWMTRWKS